MDIKGAFKITRIYEQNEKSGIDLLGWDKMACNDAFIYVDQFGNENFFGYKIAPEWGALLNADGEFFVCKKFRNCLSCWDSERNLPYSSNHDSLSECKEFIKSKGE